MLFCEISDTHAIADFYIVSSLYFLNDLNGILNNVFI
jgi:hypothetical protein